MTLKLAIEHAIQKSAPEIEEVIAEEEPGSPLLQIEITPPATDGLWEMAGGLPELASRSLLVKEVAGTPLVFLKLGGRVYRSQAEQGAGAAAFARTAVASRLGACARRRTWAT